MNAHPVVRGIVRFVVPIMIAVVLGPLIAGVPISLFDVASDIPYLFGPAPSLTFADEGRNLVAMVYLSYLIGGPIALLAGFLLSLWMVWRTPSALAVNAAAVTAIIIFVTVAEGFLGLVDEIKDRFYLLLLMGFAVFAANVCWFLLRRFARPAPAPSPQPSG